MAKALSELRLISVFPPPSCLPFFFRHAPGVNKPKGPGGYKNHITYEAFHAITGVSVPSVRACVSLCAMNPNQRLCIPQSPSNVLDSCCHDPEGLYI